MNKKNILVNFSKIILIRFLIIADTFVWIIINLLPNLLVFKLITLKTIFTSKFLFSSIQRQKIINLIGYALRKKATTSSKLSSCLSRSITAKLILSLIGIDTKIYLSMTKNKLGKKTPHAWVYSKEYKLNITENIITEKSAAILKL